jgi:hypothetical protein
MTAPKLKKGLVFSAFHSRRARQDDSREAADQWRSGRSQPTSLVNREIGAVQNAGITQTGWSPPIRVIRITTEFAKSKVPPPHLEDVDAKKACVIFD